MNTELGALAEALEDAIAIADERGLVLAWNRAACLLLGYTAEEALQRDLSVLLSGEPVGLDELLASDQADDPHIRRVTTLLVARKNGTVFQCELSSSLFLRGQTRTFVVVLRDAAARSRTEQMLQRSEDKYRALAVNAPVGIFESDASLGCVFVNRRWTEITGIPFEAALGAGWRQAVHPDDRAHVLAATANTDSFSVDYRCLWKTGEVVWVHAAAVALKDERGTVTGYMGTLVDVTERRRILDALAQSEANFRSLVEFAPFGVSVTRDEQMVYANRSLIELTGYREMSQLVELKSLLNLVHPNARALATEREVQRQAGQDLLPATIHCVRPDGSEFYVETASSLITFDGHPSRLFAVRDVTDRERAEQVRQQAEKTLRESLREKEVLLKEVHHRVKNNLQVIVSLINLQAQKVEDPALRTAFEETRGRVHAIALLHERLYGSKNLGRIDMRDYLAGLASDLGSTNLDTRPIRLSIDADELYFEIDSAVSIGLIVNELVTNAYKHAFPSSRVSGKVHVSLRRVPASATLPQRAELVLVVSDDGVGYPGKLDPDTADSLGLLLISSLSGQLGGKVSFEQRSDGARCEVRFPDRKSS